MYDILKTIAETQVGDPLADQFGFTYARRDYANLHDEAEASVPHIFLDPVAIVTEYGEYGQVEASVYSGSFMVLVASDIDDEDYGTKYIDHIKPIIDTTMATINTALQCEEIDIESWRTIEIINVFDFNMDGIAVTYQVRQYV